MSQEKDKVFFRNFSLVVGVLAVMMVVFMVAAHIVGTDENAEMARKEPAVRQNTNPMGQVALTGEEAPAEEAAITDTGAAAPDSEGGIGKQVYDGLCVSCHGLGPSMAAMIPQAGDKEAWAPRIAQGIDTLYKHALEGFTGTGGMMMPPRGGGSNTDDEVKAAVDYIVQSSQ